MKPLGEFEVWFVTGSQEMYGDETLRQVAANSGLVAPPARRVAGDPGPDRPSTGGHVVREHRRHVPCRECRGRVRRRDPLDAHVLAGPDVDRRAPGAPEAAAPPPHPVQPRSPVGRDRHGLHEPQPGRPRRSRVRLHRDPAADRPQDGRRPLAGPVRRRPDRRLVARRVRLAGGPPPQGRTIRRHDAPRRRHRGRQGRGADPAGRSPSTGSAWRSDGRRSRLCPTRRSTICAAATRRSTTSRPSCAPKARDGPSCARPPRIEAGLRGFLEAGGFMAFTDTFEDLDGLRAAARDRRPAADGRRLRLRRRGRLEDVGPGPPGQGDGDRPARAGRRSWRTTPTTSTRTARWSSGRTCSRSARRSPPARPRCEIHPLSIGARSDPVRLVFDAATGPGVRGRA